MRDASWWVAAALTAGALGEEPPSPAEALRTFTLDQGFAMELAVAEPDVAQPVYLTFDERGRLWVVQYLQYPFPAGLKVVGHDEYWRVKYDHFPPAPPPGHVRGADKITVFEDRDGDGYFETHKDFVTGLNICTAALSGRGGVWVLNPPYLLFYPDRDRDDAPDGDPIVHLAGFGMEDLHAVANTLTWGPDGWLYGLQGSTCTASITRPGIAEPPVSFMGQCVWRYHPATRRFELFAEGGYNNFGLAVDHKGRMFTGTNGGKLGVHYVQGGYYQKTWGKHGPLTNPYAFGYFEAMTDHSSGAKVSQAMLYYDDGPFPESYHDRLLVARVLQERVDLAELRPEGSTYSAHELRAVCASSDKYFRPVDLKEGPDGCVYIADWHEGNVTWNVTAEGAAVRRDTGRIYRLRRLGTPRPQPFDYGTLPSDALIKLLTGRSFWSRQMAQRVLADRHDPSLAPELAQAVLQGTGQPALEALWALAACGGLTPDMALRTLGHADPFVRLWTIRLLGDGDGPPPGVTQQLAALARKEPEPQVRSQLACTARRLPAAAALLIVEALAARGEDAKDPHLPLLLWWAVEARLRHEREAVLAWLREGGLWSRPLFREAIVPRLGQRFTTERTQESLMTCARLLDLAPDWAGIEGLLKGMARGLAGNPVHDVPPELNGKLARLRQAHAADLELRRVGVRLGEAEAVRAAVASIGNGAAPEAERVEFLRMLAERSEPGVVEVARRLLREGPTPRLRGEGLAALQRFGDARNGQLLIELAPGMDAELRDKAWNLLASRPNWAGLLLTAVEQGTIHSNQVPLDVVLTLQNNADAGGRKLIAKHWGAVRRTPDELKSRIAEVNALLRAGSGEPGRGRPLFEQTCAKCHTLFGEGKKVGPDLTGVERNNRERLVQSVVDPSAAILPEFAPFLFTLRPRGAGDEEDQAITGFLVEENENLLRIADTAGNPTSIPRQELLERRPLTVSIMPEGLLDGFNAQQIRDLFAYVQAQTPVK